MRDTRTNDYGERWGLPVSQCERAAFRGRRHDLVGKPDAGDPHVRFDERGEETRLRCGMRHRRRAKAVGKQLLPTPKAGAPLLDSTVLFNSAINMPNWLSDS